MATRFDSIFAISLVLPLVGCNPQTPPNAASTPAQPTTVASSADGQGNRQESSAVGAKLDVPVDVTNEISQSERVLNRKESDKSPSKARETPTTSTAATTDASSAIASAQILPAVEPSKEQLAAWKQTQHEPLQLLAIRESPKAGMTTNIVGLPDDRRFLLAGMKVRGFRRDHVRQGKNGNRMEG